MIRKTEFGRKKPAFEIAENSIPFFLQTRQSYPVKREGNSANTFFLPFILRLVKGRGSARVVKEKIVL